MHMFADFAKITLDLTMFTKSLERHKYDLAFVNLKKHTESRHMIFRFELRQEP
jgi:hypothetical protein